MPNTAASPADNAPALVWLRRDLRLTDNPALGAAIASKRPIVCVYVYDEEPARRGFGGASNWWLDKSLRALGADIETRGGQLVLRRGAPEQVLDTLINETGAQAIYWNRRYGSAEQKLDQAIKTALKARGLTVESFNGSVLVEPWVMKTGSGSYYKVFSPFWRALRAAYNAPAITPAPRQLAHLDIASEGLNDWGLHPTKPDWSTDFDTEWQPGEAGAKKRLLRFLDERVSTYSDDRNRPDKPKATSGLSPHLAFGEIGPTQIWRAVQTKIDAGLAPSDEAYKFLSELVWRDFSYVLLFHHPELATDNYKADFALMPWQDNPAGLRAWQRGQTGYPIVDAGMRQLWATGTMHNRVRMIAASFLTKHLLIDWRKGEDWFWDCLVDADPASNAASWQWVAGSGADAAPYFRIFNPISQGQKFDETGEYVRQWCPELSRLSNKYLFSPWEADTKTLADAGIELGETYPHPIVDHKFARERALAAYDILKERRDAA